MCRDPHLRSLEVCCLPKKIYWFGIFHFIFCFLSLPAGSPVLSQLCRAHCRHRVVRQCQPIQHKHSIPQHPSILHAERYGTFAMDCGSAEQERGLDHNPCCYTSYLVSFHYIHWATVVWKTDQQSLCVTQGNYQLLQLNPNNSNTSRVLKK